ncbi:MAG: hypothetical protein IJ273_02085, partial [Alphaproteobacteria bacterium]|nr:hypothetical protein [Alphaproteobacteria bacterium]
QPFSFPDGLTFIRFNSRSGAAAADDPSGTIILEAFKSGQTPNPAPRASGAERGPVVGGVF